MIGKQEPGCIAKRPQRLTAWLPADISFIGEKQSSRKSIATSKILYLCQHRITNPELFAYCMCRNIMSTALCCNRKQKIRLGEPSASWAPICHCVFVYVLRSTGWHYKWFWQLFPFFFFFWLFHKLFKVLQMHLFFQNSCLNFSKRHVPKCYTICGLWCMVTMQNFWPLSGWQREIIPKMKTDVLVIIISHFRLYF